MIRKHLLFELKTGVLSNVIEGDIEAEAITITPNGRYLLSGGKNGIEIYDLNSGKKLKTIETGYSAYGGRRSVDAIACSANNNTFAIAFKNKCGLSYIETGNGFHFFEGFYQNIKKLHFSPDGKLLIGNDSKSVYIWDIESLNLLKISPVSFEVKGFSPDGKQVYSTNGKDTFLWDPHQWLSYNSGHIKKITGLEFINNGAQIISSSEDGRCIFWNVSSGEIIKEIYPFFDFDIFGMYDWFHHHPYSKPIEAVYVSPDKNSFVTISRFQTDTVCAVRDIKTRNLILTFIMKNWNLSRFLGITRDSKKIILSNFEKIGIWSLKSGKKLKTLNGHKDYINDGKLFDSGKKLITVSNDNTIIIWEVSSGKILNTLKGNTNSVFSVVLTTDEKKAVTASDDGTCRLWNLENGECLSTFSGHKGRLKVVCISPDNKYLLLTSDDKTCSCRSLQTGSLLTRMEGHKENINSIVFPGKVNTVLSVSEKECILWDIPGGEKIASYDFEEVISSFAISGDKLVIGSVTGTINLYNILWQNNKPMN